MEKKTLFIGGTHGDEPIGVRALETISKQRTDVEWMIGNDRAYKQGTRCFEGDLNRSAPGKMDAVNYASRRAAELLMQSKQYDATIDIHGTSQNTGLFLIITNPSKENFALAKELDVRRIVVWPSFSPELSGPMSEYFSCGLEIECGPKESLETQKELERVLNCYLDDVPVTKPQIIFDVYDSFNEPTEMTLEEFKETTVNNETFFPLLIGTYTKANGIICYKMRRRAL